MQLYTLNIKCPDIRNHQDVMMIQATLANSPGIDIVEVDIPNQSVRVVTANQDGGIDVKQRLDSAGFRCDQVSLL